MDGTLAGSTTPGQNGPGGNGNEEILQTPELEPHQQIA